MLILSICDECAILIEEFVFYYVLLIFSVNRHGLFLTITKAFHKISDRANSKPKKIWVNKGSESYNRSITIQLKLITIKTNQLRVRRGNMAKVGVKFRII